MQNGQTLEEKKEEDITDEVKKALIVSVSDYSSSLQTLDFCKNDGQDTYQLLKSLKYEIADDHKLIGHVTYESMREAIIDFFTDVNNKAEDTLLFYYSGHGIPDIDGDIYLASSEIDPDAPYRRGFSFNELTKMIQRSVSIRIVTVLDCCYSGAAKLSKGHEEDAAKLGTVAIDNKANVLQQGEGKCLLAASQAAQEAYALKEGNHSIFTYYLLQGLKGTEKSVDSDGNITPYSLGNFIYRSILNLPAVKRPKQKPITKVEASGDIILASYPNLSRSTTVSSPITQKQFQPEPQASLEEQQQKSQTADTSSPQRARSSSSPISYRSVATEERKDKPSLPSVPEEEEYGYYRQPQGRQKEEVKTSIFSPKILIPIVGIGVAVIAAIFAITFFGSMNQTPEQEPSKPLSPPSLPAAPVPSTPTENTIQPVSVANHPPIANNQSVTTEANKPVDITLTASDQDRNDSLTAQVVSPTSYGRLGEINQDTGVVTYTPNPGYAGTDQFTFKVNDGKEDSNKTGTVGIAVNESPTEPSNNPPTANNQSVATTMNKPIDATLTASDTDVNDNLTAAIVSNPSHGTLSDVDQNTGVVTYTPNPGFAGTDSFTFKVNDGRADSNKVGNVAITVKKS